MSAQASYRPLIDGTREAVQASAWPTGPAWPLDPAWPTAPALPEPSAGSPRRDAASDAPASAARETPQPEVPLRRTGLCALLAATAIRHPARIALVDAAD